MTPNPPVNPGPTEPWLPNNPEEFRLSRDQVLAWITPVLDMAVNIVVTLCAVLLAAIAVRAVVTTAVSGRRLHASRAARPGERWRAAEAVSRSLHRSVGGLMTAGLGVATLTAVHWDFPAVEGLVPCSFVMASSLGITAGCSWLIRRRRVRISGAELHAPSAQTNEAMRAAGAALVYVVDDSVVDAVSVADGSGRYLLYRPTERTHLAELATATLALDPQDRPLRYLAMRTGSARYLIDGRPYEPPAVDRATLELLVAVHAADIADQDWSDGDDVEVWPEDEWSLRSAMEVHGSVKEAFAALSCDPAKVLTLPALFDNSEESTAQFIEAFAEANALEPSDPLGCPPEHAAQYIVAVQLCEETWEEAYQNAVDLGVQEYGAQERGNIRRARLALDLALNPTTPAGERAAALAKARNLLAGIIELPEPLERRIQEAIAPPKTMPAIAAS